ncbi:retrovirus-related pol polyprotein from transposon TNT 1-94, partial [Tanacetum coccineum]
TDNAKITRKRSKPDKHGHENGKSTTRAGSLIAKRIDQGVGSTRGIRACALRNFDLGVMELENSQNNALSKLPMLKLGELSNSSYSLLTLDAQMTGNLTLLCNFVEKYLDLQGNNLLTGNRGSDLYIISLHETTSSTPICLMAKDSPTQAWLWHRRLSHLNFDYINLLSKKDVVIGLPKLKYVKDQLCSSCKVASISGKKYILVIVDDYSRYTWTLFLKSKDETPEVLKEFLTRIQRNLQAPVISVRTDRGT